MKHSLHFLLLLLASSLLGACGNNSDQSTMDSDSSSLQPSSVIIDNTAVNGLIIYYPHFSRIDLVCATMPAKTDSTVVFCAEAAFTHVLLTSFDHTNIDGDHVSGGQYFVGAACRDNSGAFTWTPHGGWRFVAGPYTEALTEAAAGGGMGFGQALIIYNGTAIEPLWRSGTHQFRALCELEGQLCIADSRDAVPYADFVAMLKAAGMTHALYLDMGSGWNHSWWRDDSGNVHEIHPRHTKSRYCTNWITFYR